MKCDNCGGEATVHEVTIRSGKKVERHLCEQCAKGEGLPVQSQNVSVTQVLSQFIAKQASGASAPLAGSGAEAAKTSQCPACGTTYAQFRHDGLLGCPECYAAFEIQLGPLLERAHEGGTHHVGKVPRRISAHALPAPRPQRIDSPAPPPAPPPKPAVEDRAARAASLRRKLAEAIAAEQYEAAAGLRDELHRLEQPSPSAAAKPSAPPATRRPGSSKPGSGGEAGSAGEGSGGGAGSGGGGA